MCSLNCISQRFFFRRMKYLKFNNNGIIPVIYRFQKHIISSITALSVRTKNITPAQLNQKPQNKKFGLWIQSLYRKQHAKHSMRI